jgi:hypothetical protein
MKMHPKQESSQHLSNRASRRHSHERPRANVTSKPSNDSSRPRPTGEATGSSKSNHAPTPHTISVPPDWTPEIDRECFDSLWRTGATGRYATAILNLGEALDRLKTTLIIGRRVLIDAGDHAHHDAMLLLPLDGMLDLLDSALHVYPTTDEQQFFNAVKNCRLGLAKAERLLTSYVTNPEGTTLVAIVDAWEAVSYPTWCLEQCFQKEFEECQHLFAATESTGNGDTID